MFGFRPTDCIILFDAMELGWVCPKDKNHRITWSEFKDHVWCYQCKKDYFTLLCPKKMNPFTTEMILAKEIHNVKKIKKGWTLDRYQKLRKQYDTALQP